MTPEEKKQAWIKAVQEAWDAWKAYQALNDKAKRLEEEYRKVYIQQEEQK